MHPINYFISIRKNLEKSLAAGFLVSTLNKLLHEGENDERIFNLTIGWLEYLSLESSVCRLQLLDAFFVKFLSLLGFDITEMKNVVGTAKEDLMFLGKSSWEENNNFEYKKSLHNFIYKFLLYNTDRNIKDWGKIKLG